MRNNNDTDFFGGASLADNHTGSVSFRDASGATFNVNVSDDPEFTMSGLYEPDSSFDRW
jgi:hypothetical protein